MVIAGDVYLGHHADRAAQARAVGDRDVVPTVAVAATNWSRYELTKSIGAVAQRGGWSSLPAIFMVRPIANSYVAVGLSTETRKG